MSLYLMPVGEGRRIPIKKTVVFIGRHPDCDVVLSKSLKVSRRHCCLALVNNKLMVRDLGSTNGVHVNGRRIKREEILRLGDELVVGDVPFILKSKHEDGPESIGDANTEIQAANATNLDKLESQVAGRDNLSKMLSDTDDSEDDPLHVKLEEAAAEPRLQDDSGELQERSIFEMKEDEVDQQDKFQPEDSSIFK
ncbi:MAG: FHA domain-containing protein [Planctomycetaceae bacterium]